jgi:broad specificity phosphatase PhoE
MILARHGQTAANAQKLILGRADLPLTDLGRQQAAALARALAQPARVIASPLRRARETAEAFGLPVTVDDRWVELDYGGLDCVPVLDVPEDVWARWRADPHFSPAGGESLAALGARVRGACEELLAEVADTDVVVVTHVSPIKAAVAWALGAGDDVIWRLYVEDASVCRIGVGRFGPLLIAFNERHGPL